ncbi:MAG TPA: DUF3376 domain-containing protein [Cyanobacteria bacterium UBA8803]|nr:DUF3376 domain-containing protein [Cyanobacteria bacterium UBA9273]HBL62862.1 DUF3376 domain-containing protein [Cyanobacteria bacterium UBA8803]
MSTPTLKKPEFRREHRLGLVVYGGVSLAIYMNGICREFYNAVRGRGIYKLIKALTDADIIVDIISGTSAGGINGVLLSYALANSTATQVVDFKEFGQIWRESGSIRELMHHPSPKESTIESLLDGAGYYQQELANAFRKADNPKNAPEGEWLSQSNELDLFVTGTDILGRIYKVFDDTGCVIEVKNHRAIFSIKHRQGRKEPFNPNDDPADPTRTPEQTYQSLAKLCRITSCFPLAFPVVTIGLKDDANELDKRLIQWGSLETRELPEKPPKEGYRLHFVDGGVLDNRPFSYTIKEIYFRTANRPVNRQLFYIDPSPDRFAGSVKFNTMPKPNVLEVLQDSLIGLPIYESISNDLESIKERNEKVRRYKSLLSDVEAVKPSASGVSNEIKIDEDIYLRSRLIGLRDRILPLILRMDLGDGTDSEQNKQEILEKTAQLLIDRITGEGDRQQQEAILHKASKQLHNLDVDYALRQHFYIVEKLFGLLEKEPDSIEYKKLRLLVNQLNRQIKLLEVIRAALDTLLSHPQVSQSFYSLLEYAPSPTHPELLNQLRHQIYDRLLRVHRFFFDADGLAEFSPQGLAQNQLEYLPADIFKQLPLQVKPLELDGEHLKSIESAWLPQKQISSIFEQLKQKIGQIEYDPAYLESIWSSKQFQDIDKENDGPEFASILYYVEQASEKLIQASGLKQTEDILTRFQSFPNLDRVLYPFEYLTSLSEKDQIHTIRISPDDAQMGLGKGKTIAEKLAGDTLWAFGGFFKKSWRSNDMLWGRLDGLNRIFEALVTRTSLKNFPRFLERQARENRCTQEEYLELLIQECFPDAQPSDRQKIYSHLRMLADPHLQISEAALEIILNDLVLEGHRSILTSDIQNVIEDEIAEQLAWNRQRIEPTDPADVERLLAKLGDEPPTYKPVPGYFEKSVSTLAAAALAKNAVGTLSPQEKEEFFRDRYRVGKETVLKDIPSIVLTNLATRFTLVMRDIVNSTLGEPRASKLRNLLPYQFFNKSVQLFYWWLQARGPVAFQSPNFPGRRPLVLLLQVLLLLTASIAVVITVSESPIAVAIALIATILFWLLGYTWKKY